MEETEVYYGPLAPKPYLVHGRGCLYAGKELIREKRPKSCVCERPLETLSQDERALISIRSRHFDREGQALDAQFDPEWTEQEMAYLRRQEILHSKRDVLSQDEVWYPKTGDPIRVDEMSLRYKKNVLAFLERRAPTLKAAYEWRMIAGPQPSGDAAQDAFDSAMGELFEMQPIKWLYRTPLVERLEQLVREGHDGPID